MLFAIPRSNEGKSLLFENVLYALQGSLVRKLFFGLFKRGKKEDRKFEEQKIAIKLYYLSILKLFLSNTN